MSTNSSIVGALFASGFFSFGAFAEEVPKMIVPTREQRSETASAFQTLGWVEHQWRDRVTREPLSIFTSSDGPTDDDLDRLPVVPFSFGLNLSGGLVTDAGLKALIKQKELRVLHIDGTRGLTDAGLIYVAQLHNVIELHLESPLLTDDGLRRLNKAQMLRFIFLSNTQLTDKGLKELCNIRTLAFIDVSRTQITDDGLTELRALPELRVLSLGGTSVTDNGLKAIAGLDALEWLDISATKVTDAGMRELARNRNLTSLMLVDSTISDVGLRALAGIKSLKSLDLSGSSNVTESGIRDIQVALPKCKVTY